MDQNTALLKIVENFPNFVVHKIVKIGEGTGNVAYEVNDRLIFRFPKSPANRDQLAQEIILQPILGKYSILPYPKFLHITSDNSLVGYEKLTGSPLIYEIKYFNNWEAFSEQIATFLNRLHTIPISELDVLNILVEVKPFSDWQTHCYPFYEKTKHLIPSKHYPEIELFFNFEPQMKKCDKVLCHNDLGIEHILIADDNVSGIIDWGGVAIADPACDFARIYRDLGPEILDTVLSKYDTTAEKRESFRERAIFYGKCLIFEDLYCGIREDEYLQKTLKALDWAF